MNPMTMAKFLKRARQPKPCQRSDKDGYKDIAQSTLALIQDLQDGVERAHETDDWSFVDIFNMGMDSLKDLIGVLVDATYAEYDKVEEYADIISDLTVSLAATQERLSFLRASEGRMQHTLPHPHAQGCCNYPFIR